MIVVAFWRVTSIKLVPRQQLKFILEGGRPYVPLIRNWPPCHPTQLPGSLLAAPIRINLPRTSPRLSLTTAQKKFEFKNRDILVLEKLQNYILDASLSSLPLRFLSNPHFLLSPFAPSVSPRPLSQSLQTLILCLSSLKHLRPHTRWPRLLFSQALQRSWTRRT